MTLAVTTPYQSMGSGLAGVATCKSRLSDKVGRLTGGTDGFEVAKGPYNPVFNLVVAPEEW